MKILEEEIKQGDLARSEVVFDGPMVKGVVDKVAYQHKSLAGGRIRRR